MPSTQAAGLRETAIGFIKSKDWPRALTALQGLLSEAPNDVNMLYRRGGVLVQLGELEAAHTDFARVLELRADHGRALAARKYVEQELARRRAQSAGASVSEGKSTVKVPPPSGNGGPERAQPPNQPAGELSTSVAAPPVEPLARTTAETRRTPSEGAPASEVGAKKVARPALADTDSVVCDVYPWEAAPDVWAKLDEYIRRGLVQQYPCECNGTVRRITAMDVKANGVKADLHVLPDAVALVGRLMPWWLYVFVRTVMFLVSLPFLIISMPFVCAGAVILLFVGGVVCFALYDVLSKVVGSGFGLVLMSALVGFPALFLCGLLFMDHRWKWWCDFVAKLIRRNPLRGYAIALLHRYTPLLPRCFQRGDVVQLVRCEAKTGWLSGKSLLAFVQDRPLRRRPGLPDLLALPLNPRRRICFVWFEGGEDAAEAAAKAASQTLGLEISRAVFHKRKGVRLV